MKPYQYINPGDLITPRGPDGAEVELVDGSDFVGVDPGELVLVVEAGWAQELEEDELDFVDQYAEVLIIGTFGNETIQIDDLNTKELERRWKIVSRPHV